MAAGINPSEYVSEANALAYRRSVGGKFRHMSPKDSAVWAAFVATGAVQFSRVQYDVRVGGVLASKVKRSDALFPMWATLLSKRLDVVGWVGGAVWCIEVKPIATMSALGQALAYRLLYARRFPRNGNARAVVICSRVDEDLSDVFTAYGVLVCVVGPVEPGVAQGPVQWVGQV